MTLLPFCEFNSLLLSLSTKNAEIGPMVLKEEIFKFLLFIFLISLLSTLGKGLNPLFEHPCHIPITQGYFVPSLIEIGQIVWEQRIFKFWQYIFTILLLSPRRIGWGLSHWINLNHLHPSMPSLAEIGPVVLEEKIFIFSSMYFHYILIITSWKRMWLFIWTNHLHPRMICAKLVELAQWFCTRRWKCKKFTTTSDKLWSEKPYAQVS